jgi:hypothetical protein
MTTNSAIRKADETPMLPPGEIWGGLRAERQSVCRALLAEPIPTSGNKRRREELQTQLARIDTSLDKLFECQTTDAVFN